MENDVDLSHEGRIRTLEIGHAETSVWRRAKEKEELRFYEGTRRDLSEIKTSIDKVSKKQDCIQKDHNEWKVKIWSKVSAISGTIALLVTIAIAFLF